MERGNDGRIYEILLNRWFYKGERNGEDLRIIKWNIGKKGRIKKKGGKRKRVEIRDVMGLEKKKLMKGIKLKWDGNLRRGGLKIDWKKYEFGLECMRGEGMWDEGGVSEMIGEEIRIGDESKEKLIGKKEKLMSKGWNGIEKSMKIKEKMIGKIDIRRNKREGMKFKGNDINEYIIGNM